MLNSPAATVLTLVLFMMICRMKLHAHVLFLPETVSPDGPFGL